WPTNQHVWLDGGEVTYCSFFDFAASNRPCLMTQRSSTKPAANARITINRIVSTPMPHAPRRVLIVTFEQENRPAMRWGKNIRQVSQKSHSTTSREELLVRPWFCEAEPSYQ